MKNLFNNQENTIKAENATTQERYDKLGNMSMEEILHQEELPLPEEVIKARMKKNPNQFQSTGISPNMDLNTESFYLPSKNLLYGENFDGHFNLRMFTTREERIRLSSTTSFLETMVSILNNCISTSNGVVIDTKYLTEFDFIFVMYKARIVSYGAQYPITVKCPNCGNTFRYTANLDALETVYLDDNFKEPFTIGPLPKSGDTLEMRYLRIADIIEIEKEAKELILQDPDYQGDPTYNGRIEKRIETINGKKVTDYEKKIYVENLSAYDNQYINYKLSQIAKAGLNISTTAKCQI